MPPHTVSFHFSLIPFLILPFSKQRVRMYLTGGKAENCINPYIYSNTSKFWNCPDPPNHKEGFKLPLRNYRFENQGQYTVHLIEAYHKHFTQKSYIILQNTVYVTKLCITIMQSWHTRYSSILNVPRLCITRKTVIQLFSIIWKIPYNMCGCKC
jgi:hypothetical protein